MFFYEFHFYERIQKTLQIASKYSHISSNTFIVYKFLRRWGKILSSDFVLPYPKLRSSFLISHCKIYTERSGIHF